MIDWLNYHHLLYFWMVAKEGGITPAADLLHLSQPTLSTQIQKLEKAMGTKLFDRRGRTMVMTETGQMVFRYADEIFTLGRELTDAVRGRPSSNSLRLVVGVPDVLPKMIVHRILESALQIEERVQLVVYEGKLQHLLSELALHRLDVVLADSPLTPEINVRAFSHHLGQCDVTVMGTEAMAEAYRDNFPQSLDGAPMLLPTQNTTMRRALEQYFDKHDIRPETVHEFEDSALLKVFGQAGQGMIVVPSAIAVEVGKQYSLHPVHRIPELIEHFYAISVERRLKHPAVVAISESVKANLFPSDR